MNKKVLQVIFLLVVGVILGILANRNREYLINAQFIRNHLHFRDKLKEASNIYKGNKTAIFLAFGQSNAANYGAGGYVIRNRVYNFYKGDLYQAKEPLLGPDGAGISVWSRVADMMIDSGLYEEVVIVPVGIGQTSISNWVEGDCRKILNNTLSDLKSKNVKLTQIFWNQGETDNVDGTSAEKYKAKLIQLVEIFRKQGFDAPFYCSITGYFPYDNSFPLGINTKITSAQLAVIDEREDVFAGPNTDSLNLAYYRADAVHFTEKGLDKLAKEWFQKIKETK